MCLSAAHAVAKIFYSTPDINQRSYGELTAAHKILLPAECAVHMRRWVFDLPNFTSTTKFRRFSVWRIIKDASPWNFSHVRRTYAPEKILLAGRFLAF